ncbi:MAG: nucleotide exchange factor GrpE [Ktedonobacterales bacterium]|nr:nucleotide exchange factor GrpE [Ktedonobacterales bacterium]
MSEEERTPEAAATHPAPAADADATVAADTLPVDTLPADREAELARRIAELEHDLAQEHNAATDYMSRWQRAQADFANFRRRQQQEQEQMRRVFATEAAKLVLPALDGFERAFATLPPSLRSYTWIDGIALVSMQLSGALQALGIQPINADPGQPFDPARHEAIGEVETTEHPDGHIAVLIQRGYEAGGALLRPALVQVARAPHPTEERGEKPPREDAADIIPGPGP